MSRWSEAEGARWVTRWRLGFLASMNTTWEWDGLTWIETTPAASPPKGSHMAMAHDSKRSRTVMFGGCDSSGPWADTWVYVGP